MRPLEAVGTPCCRASRPPRRDSLLAGTVSGVYATAIETKGLAAAAARGGGPVPATWQRLGGCDDLPLVLVGGLSYEAETGTVVAATMGRGVYILPKAAEAAAAALGLAGV